MVFLANRFVRRRRTSSVREAYGCEACFEQRWNLRDGVYPQALSVTMCDGGRGA